MKETGRKEGTPRRKQRQKKEGAPCRKQREKKEGGPRRKQKERKEGAPAECEEEEAVSTQLSVGELCFVDEVSALEFLDVPQLGGAIVGERGKHSAVWEHSNPARNARSNTSLLCLPLPPFPPHLLMLSLCSCM